MPKIFLITSGEYSDYSVLAAYSTRELAAAALAAGLGDAIEDCDIDPTLEPTPLGCKAFFVNMRRTGDVAYIAVADPWDSAYKLKEAWRDPSVRVDRERAYYSDMHSFRCWARDEQHAIKIVNELRVRMIAENTWGERRTKADDGHERTITFTRSRV